MVNVYVLILDIQFYHTKPLQSGGRLALALQAAAQKHWLYITVDLQLPYDRDVFQYESVLQPLDVLLRKTIFSIVKTAGNAIIE